MEAASKILEIGNSQKTRNSIVKRLDDGRILIEFSGNWTYKENVPIVEKLTNALINSNVKKVIFNSEKITVWDSIFVTSIRKLFLFFDKNNIEYETDGLPEGVRKLIELSLSVPVDDFIEEEEVDSPMLSRIGERSIKATQSTIEIVTFLGDSFKAFVQLLAGKARFRGKDLKILIQETGAQALPIVTLINFLIGIIIAFVGAVQLEMFDAQIYVADLVGIAMVREMAPMMTAIILAGRSGAAFAAQIGTMMVNEEIDALNTFGFNSYEFLVLPRLLALGLMMPLLVLYADFMGVLGGLFVSVVSLDISFTQYFQETLTVLNPAQFGLGLIKGEIYGILVAIAGCLRGIQSGRSASAVGAATTSAVVTGIVFVVVASAVTTIIYNILGY
ncbi:ABC transporter, permease protein (cluster 9, phospholipid) [hydrothermal vent metagenome]|uniref:ABC transporter, permease protein (Cluster 9, phospholipid) n=1 Tax=hydrothermal vent metagenome TaxID=652676 RepID=A0A3B1BUC3_9ZZZZ